MAVSTGLCKVVKSFWQDNLKNVSKFACECMDVMLGADSHDQSQTSDQPQLAGRGVID